MFMRSQGPMLRVERAGPVPVAHVVKARLVDGQAVLAFATAVRAWLERLDPPDLVLDLSAIQEFTTGLVSELLALHQAARAAGGRLVLCAPPPALARLLQTCGLNRVLGVYPEPAEALASFGQPVGGPG